MLLAVGLIAGALALWEWAIRRRVEGNYAGGQSSRHRDPSDTRLVLPPFPVSAARPSALTAATSQQLRYYFFRCPQALQAAVMAIILAVLIGHSTASAGDASSLVIGSLGAAFLLTTLVMDNLFGYDDRGFSGMLVSGAPWRTVLVGKSLAWPIVAAGVLAVFIAVECALYGQWSAAPVAFVAGMALVVLSVGIGAVISVRRPKNQVQKTGSGMTSMLAFLEFLGGLIAFVFLGVFLYGLLPAGLPDAVVALGGLALATVAAVPLVWVAARKLERDPWRVEALLMGDPVPPPPPVNAPGAVVSPDVRA